MFRKTRIRLVILNSVIFFLIINAFGASLYFYMQYRLYMQVDSTLLSYSNHLQSEKMRDLNRLGHEEREINRQIAYLLWNNQNQLERQVPPNSFLEQDIPKFKQALGNPSIQTLTLSNQLYRVMTVHLTGDSKTEDSIQTCQLIYSLQTEQTVLHHLLLVIGIGSLISVMIALLVGYFLASRALIPIQIAWEKQQQFVSDASHELRTPLSVMKLHLDRLFRHPDHTIEEESRNISTIIHENKRMSKLVSDLLTLARSDSNEMQIMMKPVRIDEILKRTINLFQEIALIKGIQVSTHISEPLVIKGDEERLQQLFVIFMDNALKYSKEAGSISVICERNGSQVRTEIRDTGIGIAKEDLPYLFDRFYRGNKARTRSDEGTGLGLSIAKWITDVHGGKIQVKSVLGEGTQFTITLPLEK